MNHALWILNKYDVLISVSQNNEHQGLVVSGIKEEEKNKLGLSCAQLSLALASYLLLQTSCEFDMDMSWKWMN